jgi:hypothetical protein
MRSKRRGSVLVHLSLVALLITSPFGAVGAFDRAGGRTFELQRDLRAVRPRVEREPRASAYDLERLQRRLHERRIEAPRDPRLQRLEIEARQLRWQADRAARQRVTAAELPRALTMRAVPPPIVQPRYLGGADLPPRDQATALDLGRRVVSIQRRIGEIEERLKRGEVATAAQLLKSAGAELAVLRGASSDALATDPNLLALDRGLGALRKRLEQDAPSR